MSELIGPLTCRVCHETAPHAELELAQGVCRSCREDRHHRQNLGCSWYMRQRYTRACRWMPGMWGWAGPGYVLDGEPVVDVLTASGRVLRGIPVAAIEWPTEEASSPLDVGTLLLETVGSKARQGGPR